MSAPVDYAETPEDWDELLKGPDPCNAYPEPGWYVFLLLVVAIAAITGAGYLSILSGLNEATAQAENRAQWIAAAKAAPADCRSEWPKARK